MTEETKRRTKYEWIERFMAISFISAFFLTALAAIFMIGMLILDVCGGPK